MAALLPIWNRFDDSTSAAFLLIGVAVALSGCLDHRILVSRFGRVVPIDEVEHDRAST